MGKRNTDPLPEEVDSLRREVQEWRRTKAGPGTPMPAAIWEAAVRLARGFGVCRIARATGLDYVWLRKKLERRAGAAPATAPTFLEVPIEIVIPEQASDLEGKAGGFGPSRAGTVIEVAAADGSRMRIQLGAGSLDAAGVVAAFLGRSR
jgi:hypothetical protein